MLFVEIHLRVLVAVMAEDVAQIDLVGLKNAFDFYIATETGTRVLKARPCSCLLHHVLVQVRGDGLTVCIEGLRAILVEYVKTDRKELHDCQRSQQNKA